MNNIKEIGFYTLSDERAKVASSTTPLHRCELLLTKRCNFKCPYCRGVGPEKETTLDEAKNVVLEWSKCGLKNVRFSGGEPTIWNGLEELIKYTKSLNVERIAISTNGSAQTEFYQKLINAGVNDFSISLDACCATMGDMMAGVKDKWITVINNIKYVSKLTYTTVGVVLTNDNVNELSGIINFAYDMGVSDIRIISAAQIDYLKLNANINENVLNKCKILKYRLDNLKNNRYVRGIQASDYHKCPLVLDDMAVMDGKHYPCIIYMREGGKYIGNVGPEMRNERKQWFETTDTSKDPICKKNCLDVCIDYNNKWKCFH